jgi:hypothetical protein
VIVVRLVRFLCVVQDVHRADMHFYGNCLLGARVKLRYMCTCICQKKTSLLHYSLCNE